MGEKKHTIPTATAVFMAAVAFFFFDGAQAAVDLLHFVPVVGNASAALVTALIDVWAWLTFYVWFKAHGVSFVSPKRAFTLNGGFLLEITPALNALPVWTAAVLIIIATTRAEETLAKALDTVGGAAGAVGKVAAVAGKVAPPAMRQGLRTASEGAQEVARGADEVSKQLRQGSANNLDLRNARAADE